MLRSAIAFMSLALTACANNRTRAEQAPSATPAPTRVASGVSRPSNNLGKLAFSGIYSKALPNGEAEQIAPGSHPQWSPSGQWLLFLVPSGEQWVMRSDGSWARKLDECGYAVWASKDDLVTYWALDSEMTLVVEKADGSQRREWTFPDGETGGIRWSPDGEWIAVTETVEEGGQRSELWIIASDSGSEPAEQPASTPTPLPPPPTSVPPEQRTFRTSFDVAVTGRTTNPRVIEAPISGATIEVNGDGITLGAVTDNGGKAIFSDIPVSPDSNEPTRINVVVSAPGYAPFAYLWVPLYPDSRRAAFRPFLTDTPRVSTIYYSDNNQPPIRRLEPTPVLLLTPPAPPLGGIELYGSADERIELRGWSGDSKYVLFQLAPNDPEPGVAATPVSLRSVSIANGQRRELPSTTGEWQALPDTSLIAVTASTSPNMWTGQRIAVVDLVSGEPNYLTDEDTASQQPSWSPNGRQIAYVSQPDRGDATGETDEEFAQLVAGRHIWVMNSDGSGKRQVTDDPQYRDEYPLWTKDGSMILFTRVTAGGSVSLWLMSVDGGQPQKVASIDTTSQPSLWRYPSGLGWGNFFDWWRGP